MLSAARYWAVIPAAGSGVRMGGSVPKQYLPLGGRTVIEHVLDVFLSNPRITGVSVAISGTDSHWQNIMPRTPAKPIHTTIGGVQRAHSVLNVLHSLESELRKQDWVLVHDAVRPCLQTRDLNHLLDALSQDAVGGILATPLVDAVISMDTNTLASAIPAASHLWRAYTPQMFRFGLLLDALDTAIRRGVPPRDEASAMQSAGHRVRLVEGRSDNLKITRPEDLALAEAVLKLSTGPMS